MTGSIGKRPELDGEELPDMLILPQNSFAVLWMKTATENLPRPCRRQIALARSISSRTPKMRLGKCRMV
jgi:hypothetical protein